MICWLLRKHAEDFDILDCWCLILQAARIKYNGSGAGTKKGRWEVSWNIFSFNRKYKNFQLA